MIETVAGQISSYSVYAIHEPSPLPFQLARMPAAADETREDLVHDDGDDDDVELSDSLSSQPSSRPVTPSDQPLALAVTFAAGPAPGAAGAAGADEPLALSHKAGCVLGLQPGSLAHARASLEHARDEVRRTADPAPGGGILGDGAGAGAGGSAKASRRMSVAGKMIKHRKVPSVVIAAGGKDEAERRERRRRAADGVLYWQREVARLEGEQRAK